MEAVLDFLSTLFQLTVEWTLVATSNSIVVLTSHISHDDCVYAFMKCVCVYVCIKFNGFLRFGFGFSWKLLLYSVFTDLDANSKKVLT